jgi:pyridoxal/pyridoxine/pyridoxamine kinase
MRWRNCGGAVHALVDEVIGHEGTMIVEASFAERIKRAKAKAS